MENETEQADETRELPPVRIGKRLRSVAPVLVILVLSLLLLALNAQS